MKTERPAGGVAEGALSMPPSGGLQRAWSLLMKVEMMVPITPTEPPMKAAPAASDIRTPSCVIFSHGLSVSMHNSTSSALTHLSKGNISVSARQGEPGRN